jgi:hypothetical protein
VEGFCEHDNEPSGSIKMGSFFTALATVSFSWILLHAVSSLINTDITRIVLFRLRLCKLLILYV